MPTSPELTSPPAESQQPPEPQPPESQPPESQPPEKSVPWSSLILLAVVAFLLWSVRPVVPDEAPLGEAPPAVAGIRGWLVPEGASAAPTTRSADSGSLDFEALRGRVVLLEFYATWCPPCRASLSKLNELPQNPDLVPILITSPDGSQSVAEIRAFAAQQRYATALVGGEAHQAYGVRQIPYAVVVGRNGQVVWKGNPLELGCQEAIAEALAAGP